METLKFMDLKFTEEDLLPRKRVGCCRYDKKTNHIVIEVHKPQRNEYWVDLDRCKTAGQCLDWIHQVGLTKNWGKAVLVDFIDILFDYIEMDLWSGK